MFYKAIKTLVGYAIYCSNINILKIIKQLYYQIITFKNFSFLENFASKAQTIMCKFLKIFRKQQELNKQQKNNPKVSKNQVYKKGFFLFSRTLLGYRLKFCLRQ